MKHHNVIPALWLLLGMILATAAIADQAERTLLPEQYKKWLNEDVVYIISREEESVFKKLATAEERESFIEQFWQRRDSDPKTAANEFKEEHYRRIAFANENFGHAGIPGWKTDRGRTYIGFGPPTNRERNPAGAMYQRPLYEGGGSTRTYPFERWYYNRIEGVGEGIELEFVDTTMTGGFRLALRPEEKDALLHMPGGGLTYHEMAGLETRQGRIKTMDAMHALGAEGEGRYRNLSNPFTKLGTYFQVQRPAEVRFTDLRAQVQTRVTFNQIPLRVSNACLLLNGKTFLVPITVVVAKGELTYKAMEGGAERAVVHIYGSIQDISGRMLHEFEDTVYGDRTETTLDGLYFQKQLPVPPGICKLKVVVRDAESGRLGIVEKRLDIPNRIPEDLAFSSLILADYIVPSSGSTLPEAFVTAMGWKVYPSMEGKFEAGGSLGVYFEVYGFGLDAGAFSPDLEVTARIKTGAGEVVLDSPHQHQATLLSDRVLLAMVFKLDGLAAGKYELEVQAQDKVAQKRIARKAHLEVVSATK